jgi:hypothetical protein
MSDNLRDRIAEALEAEGAPPSKSDMWADAVIEALGLSPEQRRHVTDWEIVDE